ncbi:MAG: diacylglycerol/lipid kinase family protein [Microbacteriaceae bacterium]
MKPLTIVVAINPTASFGKSRDVGPAVVSTLRALGHTVVSLTEPSFAELLESGRAAVKARPDALVVVGGDGMVSLGANLVAKTAVPLGIIPAGTGNDMARGLGIPVGNAEAAIGVLIDALAREPLVIDAALMSYTDSETGESRKTWFACVLSAGFDAIVNERANNLRWPTGKNRYLRALAIELAKLRPLEYTLTIDGKQLHTRAVLVAVANNISFGGGMKIVPEASLTDGLLDVFIVKPLSRLAFIRIFPRVFSGTHVSDSRVNIVRATHVLIESRGVVGYADGERVGALPIDVRVVPGALRVLVALS